MRNERIVVTREHKRGGFWPFVGGLVLGIIAVKVVENLSKPKQTPKPVNKVSLNQSEIQMVEDLIDELTSKPNKTQKDKNNIDLLRIKLRQLRNEE
jgi:hypothetical protein